VRLEDRPQYETTRWATLVIASLEYIGRVVLTGLGILGQMGLFWGRALALIFVPPLKVQRIVRQVHFLGVRSLGVVALTGLFTGMVLGLQGYYTLIRFGSEAFLGPMVAISLITELGPVLAALMVTGRAGSALAAELGIMRITEQIDALTVMALHPLRYLVVPNILAGVLVMPLLGAIFAVVGIYGGYIVAVQLLGLNSGTYLGAIRDVVDLHDVLNGLCKSLSFGLFVILICCYKGYHAGYGAEGVSKATTEAVVQSSVTVLVLDYFLNTVLL
jgi:phospholipid/cholesterol/gamma-HCH transport system permease protein